MAKIKQSYKIPHSIDVKKGLDDPVALKSGSVGLPAPVPIKIIVMFAIALTIYIATIGFMLTNNFGILAPILFTIGYVSLARMMLKKEPTGERGFKWLTLPQLKQWDSLVQNRTHLFLVCTCLKLGVCQYPILVQNV